MKLFHLKDVNNGNAQCLGDNSLALTKMNSFHVSLYTHSKPS